MSGGPRSTSARNSSIEHTDFFFKPVQLHLQPPNLLVERVARSFPVPPFATVHEKLRKLFQRTLPPFRNLDGMHLELRTQLAQRLLAAHRLDRNPSFELRTILLSRRRHRPLLVNDSAESYLIAWSEIWGPLYLCRCLCGPVWHPGRWWIDGCHSTASRHGSPPSDCQGRPDRRPSPPLSSGSS